MRRARSRIDFDALRHNYHIAKSAAPDSRVMAVIKADAYGHGMLRVAEALMDADGFAVATIDEGLALRQAGITQTVLVLQGACSHEEYRQAARQRLTLSLHHESQLALVEAHNTEHPPLWLKVDTGMHRLGFPPQRARELIDRLSDRLTGFMTHFANADVPENPANQQQLDAFQQVTSGLNLSCSAANSAALLTNPASHFDWVRPGIMLYGA